MNTNNRIEMAPTTEKLSKNVLNDSQISFLMASNQQTIIPATITQPKSQLSQSCDLSENDGLIKNGPINETTSSKICVTSQINSLPTVSNKRKLYDEFIFQIYTNKKIFFHIF